MDNPIEKKNPQSQYLLKNQCQMIKSEEEKRCQLVLTFQTRDPCH